MGSGQAKDVNVVHKAVEDINVGALDQWAKQPSAPKQATQ